MGGSINIKNKYIFKKYNRKQEKHERVKTSETQHVKLADLEYSCEYYVLTLFFI